MNNKVLAGGSITGAIIASIIALEGGYVNNPLDPGGETKYGITREVATEYGYKGEMKDLPYDLASKIYEQKYILAPKFSLIIQQSPAIAHKLIDAGVNVGVYRSSVWFQKAINAYSNNGKDYPLITVDGKIGPSTMKSFTALEQKRGKILACELVIKLVDAQQAVHYMELKKLSPFTVGWVANRIQNIPLTYCTKYGQQ